MGGMTQTTARSQTGLYVMPILIVLVVLLVMALGSALREAPAAPAVRDAQRIEALGEAEEFHCRMFGEPSEEAQLVGFICP